MSSTAPEGTTWLIRRIKGVGRRLLRRCEVAIHDGEPLADEVTLPDGVKFVRANLDELDASLFPDVDMRRRVLRLARARTAQGDACYLAWRDGAWAGYGWVRPSGEIEITEVGYVLSIPAGATVFYDFVVFPAFRGRGLYPLFLRWLRREYAQRRSLIYAEIDNSPSLHGIAQAGFKPWRSVHSWWVLFAHWQVVVERLIE